MTPNHQYTAWPNHDFDNEDEWRAFQYDLLVAEIVKSIEQYGEKLDRAIESKCETAWQLCGIEFDRFDVSEMVLKALRKSAGTKYAEKIAKEGLETGLSINDYFRSIIGGCGLAEYFSAPWGHFFAIYADGSFSVGVRVGNEIDPEEQPIAIVKCPGVNNIDTSFWHEPWAEYSHETGKYTVVEPAEKYKIGDQIEFEDCIRVCCEEGEVNDEIEELVQELVASYYEDKND